MATPGHRGFYTAWQSASQQLSIVLAAALGYGLNRWLAPQQLADWGWRIPFFIGCAIIPCIFMLRKKLQETAEFHARQRPPDTREVFALLRANWSTVIYGMLLGAMTTATFNLITVYTPTFGRAVLHLSGTDTLLVTLCVGISNFVWLPIGGALSDRLGRPSVLLTVSLLALVSAYPAFAWLANAPSFLHLLGVLLLFSFYYGSYNGAMVPALTEVMPAKIRVMGFSLAFSLATALFGGVTLALSTYLIELTGDKAAPAYWMSFAASCSLAATLLLYRKKRATTAYPT
jgi:MHS family citrate/tricarballylate:H+ symporter-like MFS transporter